MGQRELAILSDYLRLWTRSIVELLDNLKEQCPESNTIIAEIFYWRDITRVLEAVLAELKQPYVEMVMQIMVSSDDKDLVNEVMQFQQQRDRVVKGGKEARWNNKHMKAL